MMWNLQDIKKQFWMKECDILGGQNILYYYYFYKCTDYSDASQSCRGTLHIRFKKKTMAVLWPLLHIFRGSEPSNSPIIYAPVAGHLADVGFIYVYHV